MEVSRIFIMDDEKSAVAQGRAFSAGTSKTLEWNEGFDAATCESRELS